MQSELFIVFIVREPSQRTPLTFLKDLFVHVFADLTKRKRRLFTVSVTAAGFILWHLLDLSRDKLATWKFHRGAAAETKVATALPTITVHTEREREPTNQIYIDFTTYMFDFLLLR